MTSGDLSASTWDELDAPTVVLVPLGSTEQHGPHLPLATDTVIAEALAKRARARIDGASVAPALPYGSSGEHQDFAGTLSIGTDALRHVLVELVRSASTWAARIVFVNGHGGNHDAVVAAADQLRDEGHDVIAWWPRVPGGDAHAGHTETSLMLAIEPTSVAIDRAEPGNAQPVTELFETMRAGGVSAVSDNGVLGDPTGASAEDGQQLLDVLVADLVAVATG